jgi:hypothetical protein
MLFIFIRYFGVVLRKLKPVTNKTLLLWLNDFRNVNTQKSYRTALRKFKKNLGIEDLVLRERTEAVAEENALMKRELAEIRAALREKTD